MRLVTNLIALFIIFLNCNLLAGDGFSRVNIFSGNEKYFYNRNEIVDLELINENTIALTKTGNILKFESYFEFSDELIDSIPYTSLEVIGTNTLLACRKDGSIFYLDPDNLETKLLKKLDYYPEYICEIDNANSDENELFMIYHIPITNQYFDSANKRIYDGGETIFYNISRNGYDTLDLMTHKVIGCFPQIFFYHKELDRIYFAKNAGEWGGYVGFYDIYNKDFKIIDSTFGCAYDFIQLKNGNLLCYGGSAHHGLFSNNIRLIDIHENNILYESQYFSLDNPENIDSVKILKKPRYPVDYIIDKDAEGKCCVISNNVFFETDYDFINWNIIHDLKNYLQKGKKFANYEKPQISNVKFINSDSIICSTISDGLILITPDTVYSYKLENQLENYYYNYVFNVYGKLIFAHSWSDYNPIYFNNDSIISFDPCPEMQKDRFSITNYKLYKWNDSLYSICTCNKFSNDNPVPIVLSKIVNNRAEKLDVDSVVRFDPQETFSIDDNLFFIDNYDFDVGWKMYWYKNGTWSMKGIVSSVKPKFWEDTESPVMQVLNPGHASCGLRDLYENFFVFKRNEDFSDFEFYLQPLIYKDTLKIRDGLEYKDKLLLLSSEGLMTYDIENDKLAKFPVILPDTSISVMEIDNYGNLWLGGNGLWRYNLRSHQMERIDMIGTNEVCYLYKRIKEKGVVAIVARRGMYFLE